MTDRFASLTRPDPAADSTSAAVRAQYETLPYPERKPADEAKRLIIGSPSHLAEIEHYLFGGRLPCGQDAARPFRVLIAGGGTGDALMMLGQQIQDRGLVAEIVYLDASTAARRIAEERACIRGLTGIRFVTGSLLDLPGVLGPDAAPFDYIDCCGVLHHLPDPEAGIAALSRVLHPAGGIGIMVYGALGRRGIYDMQDVLRLIAGEGGTGEGSAETTAQQRIAVARKLLAQAPASNWLRRNPAIRDHIDGGDAGLFDLLLHARDRAYLGEEVAALAGTGGLRLETFIPPARYRPEFYLTDADLKRRFAGLPPLLQAAAAERLAGNIKVHIAYLKGPDNRSTPPDWADLDAIPVLKGPPGAEIVKMLGRTGSIELEIDGLACRVALPHLAPALLPRIDGATRWRDILAGVRALRPDVAEAAVTTAIASLGAALGGLNWLLLRHDRS